MPNSVGKSNKEVRRFLRESGVAPTAANVERIGPEIRRTEAENDRVVREHKEMERERGIPSTTDLRGRDMKQVATRIVRRSIDSRPEPESRRRR